MKTVTKGGLTPRELAAITNGVPCSGMPEVDAILSLALRTRIATEIVGGLIRTDWLTAENRAQLAWAQAGALIAEIGKHHAGAIIKTAPMGKED